MKVLKFGGTSVANAESISKVVAIVKEVLQKDKAIVVVSALGGVTDLLLNAASLASAADETYKDTLHQIEHSHLLSLVKKSCNEIEDICNGIFLLRELTPRTKDRISSYGELISSQIIAAKFNHEGMSSTWKDARELILTNSLFTAAEVDYPE